MHMPCYMQGPFPIGVIIIQIQTHYYYYYACLKRAFCVFLVDIRIYMILIEISACLYSFRLPAVQCMHMHMCS